MKFINYQEARYRYLIQIISTPHVYVLGRLALYDHFKKKKEIKEITNISNIFIPNVYRLETFFFSGVL